MKESKPSVMGRPPEASQATFAFPEAPEPTLPMDAERRICSGCTRPAAPGRSVCEACHATALRASRALADRRKEAGLCLNCGKATGCPRLRCESCRAAINLRNRTHYKLVKEKGGCLDCGVPINKRSGKTRCEACRQKIQPGPAQTRERREVREQGKRELNRQRRAAGLCVSCGGANDGPGVSCAACTESHNEACTRHRDRLRAAGLCLRCGKQTEPGLLRCSRCMRLNREQGRARRSIKIANGICAWCPRPAVTQGRIRRCARCWFRSVMSDRIPIELVSMDDLQRLWDSQGGRCAYTGQPLVMGVNASLDHKTPTSRGGTHALDNLHFVTWQVNTMKNDCTHEEFLEICRAVAEGRPCNLVILENPCVAVRRKRFNT